MRCKLALTASYGSASTALANLFTELAMRLNHEFKLPGEE